MADPSGPLLVVLGGGAAGLLAAAEAGRRLEASRAGAARVILVEAAREAGRKILVSGGGRCNILPLYDAPERFVSSSPQRLVRRFLDRFPLPSQRSFFEDLLGGPLREEPGTAKLFPPSNRARDVRQALVESVLASGVELRCGSAVKRLGLAAEGFEVDLGGERLQASVIVLATGGRSVLAAGADGGGFEMARELGHSVLPVFPALAPLVASPNPHAGLSGVSVEAEVKAVAGSDEAVSRGGFLFTHRGYSGPAALNVSHVVERALLSGATCRVTLRLLGGPGGTRVLEWEEALLEAHGTRQGFLRRLLPDRVVTLVLEAAGVGDGSLARTTRDERRRLVSALEDLPLPVTGTEGYRTAEVTGGGVALDEVDLGTGESRRVRGLFLAGEVLDVFGPIGGFNFQWAWATGRTAGVGAARRLLEHAG